MDPDRLVRLHPTLFHMAAAGAWPSIREHGLLTTLQIVQGAGLAPAVAVAVLEQRRLHSVRLRHPVLGDVVIRDQSPLRPHILEQRLVGMTSTQWLAVLNDRVFLWLHEAKLQGLLRARRYRQDEHDVLVVDTASFVAAYADRIRLSPINSGATLYPNAAERGPQTFRTIADYPYDERRRGRGPADAIAELAVPGGVPDVARFVVRVERHRGPEHLRDLPL